MKRTLEMVVAMAMMTIPLTVSAQKNSDPEGFVTYSLPSTVITLEVEAVQEKFHAGMEFLLRRNILESRHVRRTRLLSGLPR